MKLILTLFACVLCIFVLTGCAPEPKVITQPEYIPVEKIVYQDRVNPQHFVVVQNDTVYMSFCNTSLNLSSLATYGLAEVTINGTGYLHNQSLRLIGVDAPNNEILLSISNNSYIVKKGNTVEWNNTYYTLRELFTMTHPRRDAIAYIEIKPK